MFVSIVEFLAIGILIIVLAFIEYLDWQGRLDIIRDKHPKVWAAMNNRPVRLVLLIACLGFLTKDFKDVIATAPAPIIKIGSPPLAIFQTLQIPPDKDMRHRREIREQLGRFINEGSILRDRAFREDDSPKMKADWIRWRKKVEQYLRENLDASYESRFKTMNIAGFPVSENIINEIKALDDILVDLKD